MFRRKPKEPVEAAEVAEPANPLADYFYGNQDRHQIHKWLHYFEIYHRHFAPYRNRAITVVDFGVFQGGSLQMWREYFGPRARIVGVDIDARCAAFAEPGIEVVIGDQADAEFLRSLATSIGPIDVVIEDGGHTMEQQLTTFRELWPSIVDGGLYLVEDLHTSYWADYGGGYRKPGTFIEHAKSLIDSLNAWHSRDEHSFLVDDHTTSVRAMHVYDSVIVFDKDRIERPDNIRIGQATIDW